MYCSCHVLYQFDEGIFVFIRYNQSFFAALERRTRFGLGAAKSGSSASLFGVPVDLPPALGRFFGVALSDLSELFPLVLSPSVAVLVPGVGFDFSCGVFSGVTLPEVGGVVISQPLSRLPL